MINIRHFCCNMLQENCYIVSDESHEAVIIDCGALYDAERQAICDYIDQQQLTVRHLVSTHAHFDHCFGNATIWQRYGLQPSIPRADAFMVDLDRQMQQMMGMRYDEPQAPVGRYYDENDTFCFGSHQLSVLSTPGHSPGSCCLYCPEEHILFSGDTLFAQSIGRTDFEGGNWTQMQQSLRRLAQLPADTRVLPGHGPQTTIGQELLANPYLNHHG
jgi:glyoxylase-like metal-dependent hydrolase (beta-lactamase superfamily II)